MHFQFVVAPPTPSLTPPAVQTPVEPTQDLLRQLLEVQKEQVALLKAGLEANNNVARWQAFLARWDHEFPDLAHACEATLPLIERALLRLIEEMAHRLQDEEAAGLDLDYALGDFLDRYAMRISQLGTVLHLMGPLAEAGKKEE